MSGTWGNAESRGSTWDNTWHIETFSIGAGGDQDDDTDDGDNDYFQPLSLQKSESDAGKFQGQNPRWDRADA